MSLSWIEIQNNAVRFQDRWKDASDERAEAQTFLYELLRDVYGVDPRRVATFEKKVHPSSDKNGYIDMLWPGRILIEMKSKGKSLDKAHDQARKYAFSISNDEDLPEYIMVCDFARIRLYNLTTDEIFEFETKDLSKNVRCLSILTDQATKYDLVADKELNVAAAYKMAKLHDMLKEYNYEGHSLEIFLVRILFCLFADHTGIFAKRDFYNYIKNSRDDGSDLAGRITTLFEVLDTPAENRMVSLSEELKSFPYVNGGMFNEVIRSASFNREMREVLLDCCSFAWSEISPSIFGAMFQGVMDPEKRVELGEQYTPQYIIKKTVKPLFLDELYCEFEKCKGNATAIQKFKEKLSKLTFLDPACGCGNFLVVTYSLLRKLELSVIRYQYPHNSSLPEDFDLDKQICVNVNQFYGMEIEEFPCYIAQAALWLIDHKMNVEAAQEFGTPFMRIPLINTANIHQVNALTVDWRSIIPAENISYVLGNPPYYGAKKMKADQRSEIKDIFQGTDSKAGILDYVAGWYMLTARYIQGTRVKAAFVSTNSITQGEQVYELWNPLFQLGIHIDFAYRSFKWTNEARDMSIVHCVIMGISATSERKTPKLIYNADDTTENVEIINPYLDGLAEITLVRRVKHPICKGIPEIKTGNKPIDNGNYIFKDEAEKDAFLAREPKAKKYIHEYYGSREFLYKKPRYILTLQNCTPAELSQMPLVTKRVEAVKTFRENSSDQGTRDFGSKPRRFHIEVFPNNRYMVIPEVTSENRKYIPMGFLEVDQITSNLMKIMESHSLYHFGVLTSWVHMIWVKSIGGRLEERYRYTKEVVYNTFPWPTPTKTQKAKIESLAKTVLDIRAKYPQSSYADLYNPAYMPDDLSDAHKKLDKAVLNAYGLKPNATEQECLVELYKRYREINATLSEEQAE